MFTFIRTIHDSKIIQILELMIWTNQYFAPMGIFTSIDIDEFLKNDKSGKGE